MSDMGLLQTYKAYSPVYDNTLLLTLQEGNAPLVCAEHLSNELDPDPLFQIRRVKLDRYNETNQEDGLRKASPWSAFWRATA